MARQDGGRVSPALLPSDKATPYTGREGADRQAAEPTRDGKAERPGLLLTFQARHLRSPAGAAAQRRGSLDDYLAQLAADALTTTPPASAAAGLLHVSA